VGSAVGVFTCLHYTPLRGGEAVNLSLFVEPDLLYEGKLMENSVPLAGSGLLKQKIATLHHPEGIDPDQMCFDEARVHALILAYQRDGDPETWQAIVMGCLPLIDSLIRKHRFQIYEDLEALRNECVIKLFKAIRHYNPERGRAFSCLTVAFTRFLFSYVATIRTRTRRFSLVPEEILTEYASPGQGRTELPEELKNKIKMIQTRFKAKSEKEALRFLINYFLLEGFSQPRKLVLDALGVQFNLSLEKAGTLYNYALVSLRSVLHEYYTPVYSPGEMVRLCRRSTLLAEIHQITGEKCFARLMDVFAGLTVSFPSKSALLKMHKSQEFLNGLDEEAFSPGPLSASAEEQLLSALVEGDHIETPLYASEGT
jgi:hypothetical protein